jgi:hypothetical protein
MVTSVPYFTHNPRLGKYTGGGRVRRFALGSGERLATCLTAFGGGREVEGWYWKKEEVGKVTSSS